MVSIPRPRHPSSPLRAATYGRVSTEEQKLGFGIPSQDRRNISYIGEQGWDHVASYVDAGVSGTLGMGERPDFDRAMSEARTVDTFGRRPWDVLVVTKGDRIGRMGRAFWVWVWELEDLGIFVALSIKKIDNTTKEGRAEFRREADYAETEWEMILSRTQDGLQEKAGIGGWTGGPPPYGWKIKHQGKKARSRLAPRKREVRVIRLVVEWLVAGLGFTECANRLNSLEILTRKGRPWTRLNLRDRILSEPVLTGGVTFRSTGPRSRTRVDAHGNPVYGPSVVIPADIFLSESEIIFLNRIAKSSVRGPRKQHRTYTLSGRFFGPCDDHYLGSSDDGERMYECHSLRSEIQGGHNCGCPRIEAEPLEEAVWGHLCAFLGDSGALRRAAADWIGTSAESGNRWRHQLSVIDKKIRSHEAAIGDIGVNITLALGADSEAAAEAIRAGTSRLASELADLRSSRAEIAGLLVDEGRYSQRSEDVTDLAAWGGQNLRDFSPARQSLLLGLLDVKVRSVGEISRGIAGRQCQVRAWYLSEQKNIPSEVTDQEWEKIEPLLSRPAPRGDVRRRSLEAILFKARKGVSWTQLPPEFGHFETARRSWERWAPVWPRIDGLLSVEGRERLPLRRLPPEVSITGRIDPRLLIATTPDEGMSTNAVFDGALPRSPSRSPRA